MPIPQYSAVNGPFVNADGRLSFAGGVFLRDLWLRTGGAVALTNNDLDSMLQFDIREADSAELQKRVNDLESAIPTSCDAAVAELQKRISDLEVEIGSLAAVAAQVAQLRSQVADLQNQGMF